MYGPAPPREPMTPSERWIYAVFLTVILGLMIGEVFTNYEPVKLSALLVVMFWVPLLAVHEAGHAVMAALVGWRVHRVVIGMGRLLGEFQVGGALVEIRLFPVEGFVTTAPRNLHAPRLKSALIYFAGPGGELAIAGLVAWLIGPRLFRIEDNYALITWQSLALAAAVQGILNLLPHAIPTYEGTSISDGLGIIRSFTRPPGDYAAMLGQPLHEREENDPQWWEQRR